MANTFIELNDTPSDYAGSGSRFLRVNANASELVFGQVELNDLADVQANLAYTPSGGQALIYSSAAGKWRPGTMDVYSAGNGLNKNALTLNVVAGGGGGLTSNSSGVFITDIADVAGTWGNASYMPVVTINSKGQVTDVVPTQIVAEFATTITDSFVGNISGTTGQIRVTGGTGNNSNAVIDLVATGVTAATYGNSTHLPQITVDTYGRIQNVDLIEIVGGGGEGTVVASNTLGFANIIVSGQTTVSADRPQDTLTFVAGSGSTITTQANADIITFGVNAAAVAQQITAGQLADIDVTGITNGQVLIWNSSTSRFAAGDMLGGSGNSNVDLTDFSVITATPSGNGSLTYNNAGVFTFTPANTSASSQSLSWNSNNYQLAISNGNSVDLSALVTDLTGLATESYVDAAVANVAPSSSYGDSNVTALLSNVNVSVVPSANNVYSLGSNTNRWAELFLSGNSIYIDTGVLSTTDNNLFFNSDAIATTAYVDNAIAEITNGAVEALDTLGEIANALNNSNATLSTVAFTGNYSDLTNRPNISIVGNTYLVYDNSNIDLSGIVGQRGEQGNAGISIADAAVTNNNLIITLTDNTTIDAGNVRGPAGERGLQGNAGVSITNVSVVDGNLVLDYSNTSTQDVGNIRGPKGDAGNDGLTVTEAAVNSSGNLIITLSDTSTVDAGNVRGADGADGTQLTDISVTTVSPSGNGSLSYNNLTGVLTFAPADLSTVTGNVDLTGYATEEYVDSAVANVSASGGDITAVTAGVGLAGGGSTGDITISLANTAVTPGTYGSSTKSARITVDQQGRVTGVTEATISGGGGGSGATVERFRLNYTSAGALAGTANLSAGIATVSIDSASGGECTITFANGTYFYPPAGVMFYGYDHTNNKYQIVPMETSMGFREVPAGGTSGSPTLFNGNSQVVVKLRLREAETGASRGGFGTTTHAWIQFVMYD